LFLRHSILSTTRYRDSLAGLRKHDPCPRIRPPAFQGCKSLFFSCNCSSYGDTQNLQFERCARVAFDRILRYRFPSKLANQVIAYAPPLLSPPGWCLRTATIQIIYPPKAVSAFPLSGGRTACRQARTDVRAVSVCRSRRVRWHNPSGIRFDWCCLVGRRHRKGFASGAVTFCRLARDRAVPSGRRFRLIAPSLPLPLYWTANSYKRGSRHPRPADALAFWRRYST
jgi:hypothetical protein